MSMNLYERIPNNVNLSEDKRLQRALEKWLPDYLNWWREMGPEGFQEKEVYLRTAVGVDADGWANFDFVKMPDYRWGIFLKPDAPDARINFGGVRMFTARDRKYQLAAWAESGFEPLARACQFMLTEEAHHLFVGETGVGRVVKRTAELMQQGDVRALGGIPLDIIQRYFNFWFSYSLDLFGGEISSNSADFFAAGLKGRFKEQEQYDDHLVRHDVLTLTVIEDGKLAPREVPMRNEIGRAHV